MKNQTLLPAVVVLAAGSVASGQSINIDFGAGPVAAEDYAAAGLAGVWNGLAPTPGAPEALVGLDGEPVTATVTIAASDLPGLIDDPRTTGDAEDLMDDLLFGLGDVVVPVTFSGLQKGTYELITYGWFPGAPEQETSVFIDDGDGGWNGQTLGGPWPGVLTAGITHAVHVFDVDDGTIFVSVVGSFTGSTGALNGMQLRQLSFLPEDVNQDGAVNADDLVVVIMNWTIPGHGCDGIAACPGDVNGDQVVDVFDLTAVIMAWSP